MAQLLQLVTDPTTIHIEGKRVVSVGLDAFVLCFDPD